MAGLEEWSSSRRRAARRARRGTEFGLRLAATLFDLHDIRLRASVLSLRRPGCARRVARQQPPGQLTAAPGAKGAQPEFTPPTIRDYKPKSTLVVPQHPVPRAKFPVIDIHSHQPTPISAAEFDRVVRGDGRD